MESLSQKSVEQSGQNTIEQEQNVVECRVGLVEMYLNSEQVFCHSCSTHMLWSQSSLTTQTMFAFTCKV